MRRLVKLVLVLALVLVSEAWAFRVPPVGAKVRKTLVTCRIADHFSGTVGPDTNQGYVDFSIGESCSHRTLMMSIHSTLYLDDVPAATISEVCLKVKDCHRSDFGTTEVPVTLQLKSNWAITLPRHYAFSHKGIPTYCVTSKRAIACHHVSAPQTLG